MKYILIIVVYWNSFNPTSTSTAVFESKEACKAAAEWVISTSKRDVAACFPAK